MNASTHWLHEIARDGRLPVVQGLVPVRGYDVHERPPEEVAVMEKAASYGADAVFFQVPHPGGSQTAQAFIFVSDWTDEQFARLHQRLWSWGGVPLLYRRIRGCVQLYRCAHKADFLARNGTVVCRPIRTLLLASAISADPWWDAERLRNGTLWDDHDACKLLLSGKDAAQKALIDEVRELYKHLNAHEILPRHLRRKLLILSLLIAYLEERGVFEPEYFNRFLRGATKFFQVLADGAALVQLLVDLEGRFNGNVFALAEADQARLRESSQLARFARLVQAREDRSGQLTLWQRYSFRDLPVELISHIYQLFVSDASISVYTPHFLVRFMLGEVLTWSRLDWLTQSRKVILDPSCGSGVFLVEAYKRLVLHWRSRHEWRRPGVSELKSLLGLVQGVDVEEGAVELAAFSLCLALCDALEPEEIRASVKLFPALLGESLHHSCFFDAREQGQMQGVGIVVGNPPFTSALKTPGARRACKRYEEEVGPLPDKQLAFLFLHDAMQIVAPGGVLCLLQQYNFLYNRGASAFRRAFFQAWDVREVLDFVSIRGLFQRGGADTKVVVIVAEAREPREDGLILHATFRRTGRADAEQGFDLDYYDMHWLPRSLVLTSDLVWRANLFGGGRVLDCINRLSSLRTLHAFAEANAWDSGDGYIEGADGAVRKSGDFRHIWKKPLLPSEALTADGIDEGEITEALPTRVEEPRSEARFTPPMLLVRKHMDLHHALWTRHYLTYKDVVVGFCAPEEQRDALAGAARWIASQKHWLKAFVAVTSPRLFTRKATAVATSDIFGLPYPKEGTLGLSPNEKVLLDDVVGFYCDLIRLGDRSLALGQVSSETLDAFAEVYTRQISAICPDRPLRHLPPHTWPGVVCLPCAFGSGDVDWSGADELRGRLDALLHEQRGAGLHVARVTRIYDGEYIYLLKPDRVRFWIRSVALRDADETLADLRHQPH